MTDLSERLLALADTLPGDLWNHPITAEDDCRRAAAEIERLEAVVVRLLQTLEGIGFDPGCGCSPFTGACVGIEALRITVDEMRSEAREAAEKARAT